MSTNPTATPLLAALILSVPEAELYYDKAAEALADGDVPAAHLLLHLAENAAEAAGVAA